MAAMTLRRISDWLSRPVGRASAGVLAFGLCVLPGMLMADALRTFQLGSDDFHYFAASRTAARLLDNLWEPHNFHVVPFFRAWTWLVITLAGGWQHLQVAAAAASYAALVLVMLLGGHLVTRETGDGFLGLAAMIGLGVTTVMQPATTWYAASQTLWAGVGVLATLWALQRWRRGGGVWPLALAALTAALAAGSWSGGYAVGPVAVVYLWADGSSRCRKAALAALTLTALAVAALLAYRGKAMLAPEHFYGRQANSAIRPERGAVYTLQAVPEALVLANLGLDVATTASQGVMLSLILILGWAWQRWRAGAVTPLELAGGTLVLISFWLSYSARGYDPFSSVRTLKWYHTLPQIGAVLFVCGWRSGMMALSTAARPLSAGGALGVLALAGVMTSLHWPAAHRLLLDSVPRMTASEARIFLIPSLQRQRALALATEQAERQRRLLRRLDQIESVAREHGIGRTAIARAFPRIDGGNLPEPIDALEMLDVPDEGRQNNPQAVRAALNWLMVTEPQFRPPWLDPNETWPPP
jgi:hypothetical protein